VCVCVCVISHWTTNLRHNPAEIGQGRRSTLLDRLKCDGYTNLFDKLDGKALRTLCDFRNADFYPRKTWIKREFLRVKTMAAIMRVVPSEQRVIFSSKRLGSIGLKRLFLSICSWYKSGNDFLAT